VGIVQSHAVVDVNLRYLYPPSSKELGVHAAAASAENGVRRYEMSAISNGIVLQRFMTLV
jgi:hypothetical protein